MTPDPYFFIVIFCGVALVFPLMPLALAWLWRRFFQPPKPGPAKNATYECGIESIGEAQMQFQSQYYLYCIIFLIFDVEAIFLVPFAVAFTGLPVGAFIAILVFLLLADRRTGLGMEQRLFKLGEMNERQIDEGLRSELQKQGIWVTSMQELYNGAARIRSGRCNSVSPVARSR